MSELVVRDLSKTYGHRKVVDNASLAFSSGEVVGLLGPNGAGKTTCFYMIIGLIRAESGQILLDNQDITPLPMHLRARLGIGYLPQEASIFRKMTVADNIYSILQLRKDLSKEQCNAELEGLLEEFNIQSIRHQLGISLSGGERRRVEIARALAMRPRFIFLDEPFAGVDPISIGEIQRIIAHLAKRGIGVLITDHNVRETLNICDRAYILNQGQVIAQGDTAAVLDHPLARKFYLGESFRL